MPEQPVAKKPQPPAQTKKAVESESESSEESSSESSESSEAKPEVKPSTKTATKTVVKKPETTTTTTTTTAKVAKGKNKPEPPKKEVSLLDLDCKDLLLFPWRLEYYFINTNFLFIYLFFS